MSYRDRLYSAYVSTHTSKMYGEATLDGVRAQYPAWESYFGRFLPRRNDAKLLDIGCGNGGFVHFLHERGCARAEGVDVSPEQVALASKLGIRNISCADIAAFLSGRREEFDVIFARDVIEHFAKEEVLGVFDAIRQALVPGGRFVCQVPNGESPMSGGIRYGDFSHESAFTRMSLRQIFSATGYDAVECFATRPVPKGFASSVRCLIWKMMESVLRFYVLVETGATDGIFTQTIIAAGAKGGGR
jgi:cyclopropane fatty-acyl-phospholipid synthase-like methyltransferase